jgi:ABC-type multidrug transport system permease subunit
MTAGCFMPLKILSFSMLSGKTSKMTRFSSFITNLHSSLSHHCLNLTFKTSGPQAAGIVI